MASREGSGPQEGPGAPDDIPLDSDGQKALLEIWTGEDADMARNLEACLRESSIRFAVDEAGGKQRLRVMSDSEARAREIVREVIEGTPPE